MYWCFGIPMLYIYVRYGHYVRFTYTYHGYVTHVLLKTMDCFLSKSSSEDVRESNPYLAKRFRPLRWSSSRIVLGCLLLRLFLIFIWSAFWLFLFIYSFRWGWRILLGWVAGLESPPDAFSCHGQDMDPSIFYFRMDW